MDPSQANNNQIIKQSKEILSELFKASLIAFLILYLADDMFTGFVSDYFNINIVLIIALISGILTVALKVEMPEKTPMIFRKSDYLYLAILSFGSMILIYYRLIDLGKIAYLISIIAGIMIFLISVLLYKDSTNE